jgi:hypothetical protein
LPDEGRAIDEEHFDAVGNERCLEEMVRRECPWDLAEEV